MERAPELVQLMERIFRSWAARDHGSMMDAVSSHPGVLVIGTDPEEWWVGARDFSAVVRAQWQETPPFGLEVEEIVGWKEGTVGWVGAKFWMAFVFPGQIA